MCQDFPGYDTAADGLYRKYVASPVSLDSLCQALLKVGAQKMRYRIFDTDFYID